MSRHRSGFASATLNRWHRLGNIELKPPEAQMNGSRCFEKIALAVLLTALAGGCTQKLAPYVAMGQPDLVPESSQLSFDPTQGREIPNSKLSQQAPGLVVHLDPATGEILPKPPGAPGGQELEPQLFQSAPAPAPQLLEVPSATLGGGVKVNLNRQFHQPLLATMDADGKIKIEHRPARQAE